MNVDIHGVWSIYKATEQCQEAIRRFQSDSASEITLRYDGPFAKYVSLETLDDLVESFYCYYFSEMPQPVNKEDAAALLLELGGTGFREEGECIVAPEEYNLLIDLITPLSFAASKFAPDYFYPYLYKHRYMDFIEAIKMLGFDIPTLPKKTDYESRYVYYWRICEIFNEVRRRYNLSHEETCVLFYDLLPSICSKQKVELPEPTQCWFIGGIIASEDIKDETTIWQVNKDTRPGDILVHYETSPISAITTIWRAQSDACIDPFFHWHCYTKIGNCVNVPHISLAELKQDGYFSTFPLTKKNFQGVNGFRMDSGAYQELLRMLSAKGADTSSLPKLYAPEIASNPDIVIEHDVEELLIIPLIESLGLVGDRDYKRQMGIHIGSGHRVFPDIVVYYNERQETAEIIIEAKLQMRNRAEIERAFMQARSYALCMKSRLIILSDEHKLLIYEKKDSDFDKEDYKIIGWADVGSPDVFNQLKTTILNNKSYV